MREDSDQSRTTADEAVATERGRCARIARYWYGADCPAAIEIERGEGAVEPRQPYATPGAKYPR